MTTDKKQSAIAEVRDQLSLDFADDNYLTNVGQNLGLQRPLLGFNDTTWRAVVKELALEFRQIKTKFADILSILIGPRITQVGTLVQAVSAGDSTCILNDTSNFPQKGELIFDEGLIGDDKIAVLASIGASSITLTDSSEFPTVYPYTITIAPETVNEEQVTVTNNAANVLTFTETLQFAQGIGTDVIWGTQEVVEYCYIDRRYNQVYLEDEFVHDHVAMEFDVEKTILSISPNNELVCTTTEFFPNSLSTPPATFPYTIVLGRGTSEEEVISVYTNDTNKNILTLSAAPSNTHLLPLPTDIKDQLLQDYFFTSSFVLLEDSTKFPETGLIKLVSTTIYTVSANGSGPTDREIDLAASTFTANALAGYEIVFDPTTATVALRGLTRQIVSNTDAIITVSEDFSGPGTAPQLGDTFTLRPIVEYTNNDSDTGTLTLLKPIAQDGLSILLNSDVDLMRTRSTVALAPVKFTGSGWDLLQSTPRLLEILIPTELLGDNDLRSASYLHDDTITVLPSTTTSAAAAIEDEVLEIVPSADFPVAGIVTIDSSETVAYNLPLSALETAAQVGDTSLVLSSTVEFPSSGSIIMEEGTNREETVVFSANDPISKTLTVAPLTRDHKEEIPVRCISFMRLQAELVAAYAPGVTVVFKQLFYGGTFVPKGDYNQEPDTWPGPYVYQIDTPAPTPTGGTTTLNKVIPGPAQISIGQVAGRTAIEVENGLDILAGIVPPFDCVVGGGTSAVETLSVTDVNVRGRALTTVSGTAVSVGDTTIEVASLGTPGLTGEVFPDTNGYRVVINEEVPGANDFLPSLEASGSTSVTVSSYAGSGFPPFVVPYTIILSPNTANEETALVTGVAGNIISLSAPLANTHPAFDEVVWEPREVVYVVGTLTGPPRLVLEDSAAQSHALTDSVSLMSDVLTVENVSKDHDGSVPYTVRSTFLALSAAYYFPPSGDQETATPVLPDIELVSSAGFDTSGDRVILNFGYGQIARDNTLNGSAVAGATTITLNDASDFPSTYPYTIRVGVGKRTEELLLVTLKAGNVLTLGGGTYGLLFAHSDGEQVSWNPGTPETVEYDEIDGNELRFDSGIMLQYTHYPVETVLNSSADSEPATNGFDFPLRMPDDIRDRLQYLIDIVRAAGVQVALIETR